MDTIIEGNSSNDQSIDRQAAAGAPVIPQELGQARPARRSFLDRFLAAVQRLPIPYWLTYLTLFLLESLLLLVASWLEGWLPAYQINPMLFLFPLWLWLPFTLITYLNSVSVSALSGFAPLMDISEAGLQELKNEFTSLSTRAILISGAFWIVVYILFTLAGYRSFYLSYGLGRTLSAIVIFVGLISYSLGSIIYYHSLRQLRLVHRTMKLVRRYNLFRLDPVYSFSLLTSRTGIAWVFLLSFTLLTLPIRVAPIPILSLLVIQVVMAFSAFILPLRAVHHHLVLEKRRLLAEHHQRLESTLDKLHQRLEKNQFEDMAQFNNAINGLNSEREILMKIPTWPWRAGMLKDFVSITILPIVLFLVQFAISHWLIK